MKSPLQALMGQEVTVVASGILYRGTLKEVTEERVCLQARTGWREIPMEQVTEIRPGREVKGKPLESSFSDWQDF